MEPTCLSYKYPYYINYSTGGQFNSLKNKLFTHLKLGNIKHKITSFRIWKLFILGYRPPVFPFVSCDTTNSNVFWIIAKQHGHTSQSFYAVWHLNEFNKACLSKIKIHS